MEVLIPTGHLQTEGFPLPKWYAEQCDHMDGKRSCNRRPRRFYQLWVNDTLPEMVAMLLLAGGPYPGDENYGSHLGQRFEILHNEDDNRYYLMIDHLQCLQTFLDKCLLENDDFDIFHWYHQELHNSQWEPLQEEELLPNEDYYFAVLEPDTTSDIQALESNGIQVPREMLAALERNASVTKDMSWTVLRPIVMVAKINSQSVQALIDSGSLGDFMSATLTDQLKLKQIILEKPLPLQLAVQGSCSKINTGTCVEFQYQAIKEDHYFNIMNISNYDLILGCPWIYQHRVSIGLNLTTVIVGSQTSLPLEGNDVMKIASCAMVIYDDAIDKIHQELIAYAEPICVESLDMDLPLPPIIQFH